MKQFYWLLLCMSLSTLQAQKCRTSEIRAAKIAKYPDLQDRIDAREAATQKWIKENPNHLSRSMVITIPVVIHILHNAPSENISDAQILSQIEVLNKDFRKLNTNFGNTPSAFTGVAADVELEFCLATTDPSGNPSTGITRTSVGSNFDIENDYFDSTYGGKDPWDVNKYLNIWIGNLGNGNLGFAIPPGEAYWGNDDGVVVDYRAWGTIGTAAGNQPNHLGRTATHEIGHYFNLEHTWGAGNGGCNEDDGVNDTPLQDRPNYDCPGFPETDDCTSGGNGIMYVNYMGYADDNCMTMFTQGQKSRMLAALNGPRAGLLTNTACGMVANNETILDIEIDIYPNPSSEILYINMLDNTATTLQLIDVQGQIVYQETNNKNLIKSISLSQFTSGIYFVKVIQNQKSLTQKVLIIRK